MFFTESQYMCTMNRDLLILSEQYINITSLIGNGKMILIV